MSAGTIVVAGGVLRRVTSAGHIWAFAQYVRGFRRLGYQTLFLDALAPDEELPAKSSTFSSAVELLGGADAVTVLGPGGASVFGVGRDRAVQMCNGADAVVNVMGYLTDAELLAGPTRRIFLDIDPGFGQMWRELGMADVFAGHDAYVTVGTRLGAPECSAPTCGLRWIPTLPPVVLEDWPVRPGRPEAPITSVVSWRGPFGPVEFRGGTYGVRVHEFRRFVELPRKTVDRFELALAIDAADHADREALQASGWILTSPEAAAGDPERYRAFLEASKAEVMVAKQMYVATHAGWFSDRSACYLALGRPVAAQETGWSNVLPSGNGLVAFNDLPTAASAIEDISARYADHCEAARALAEDHFDSDIVLGRLLEQAGVG